MRLITPADDEIYGLASAAGKLGRAAKLLGALERACEAAPEDPEAAGRHALALMAVLPSIGIEFAAHARFSATIEAFGRTIELEPDHWLARYGRARLRTMIPSSYGAYSVQTSGELAAAREDLEHLLALQSGLAPQPYFVSAHALAAVVEQLADEEPDNEPEEQAPVGESRLAEALRTCPRVPVGLPALGAILCEPLATLYAGAAAEREEVGTVMSALYGDQAAVAAARVLSARG